MYQARRLGATAGLSSSVFCRGTDVSLLDKPVAPILFGTIIA
jgi:hypothetical protein